MPLAAAKTIEDLAQAEAARLPVDAELRSAASGHAHHAAAGAEARRRARRRRHARHRLPALRLREDRRASELQPVRDGHRPDELHLADGQQRGLARRGREAAGPGADAALQVHPHDHLPSWPGSAITCCATARWGSTPARSPSFCTRSISAKCCTTFSRRCAAPASPTATRASAA